MAVHKIADVINMIGKFSVVWRCVGHDADAFAILSLLLFGGFDEMFEVNRREIEMTISEIR
jgi:hypothetical protein